MSGSSSKSKSSPAEKCARKVVKKAKLSLKKKQNERASRIRNLNNIFAADDSLNQTADFSGGFTPYKKIAERKKNETKDQAKDIGRKKVDPKDGAKALKGRGKSAGPGNGEGKNPADFQGLTVIEDVGRKGSTDDSNPCKDPEQQNEKGTVLTGGTCEGDLMDKTQPGYKDEVGDNTERCGVCEQRFEKAVFQEHFTACMKAKFQRGQPKSAARENKIGTVPRNLPSESNFVFCQFCNEDITAFGINDRMEHVNRCMDQQAKPGTDIDARIAQLLEDQEKQVKVSGQTDHNLCHICQKDLKHLNLQRKTQHINRCVDQKEEEERKKKKVPTATLR